MSRTYAGAFGFADDVALLAPSLSGLERKIHICEDYAEEYYITLQSLNYYVIICYLINAIPNVTLCGTIVDNRYS